jgi:hypothetical protein
MARKRARPVVVGLRPDLLEKIEALRAERGGWPVPLVAVVDELLEIGLRHAVAARRAREADWGIGVGN